MQLGVTAVGVVRVCDGQVWPCPGGQCRFWGARTLRRVRASRQWRGQGAVQQGPVRAVHRPGARRARAGRSTLLQPGGPGRSESQAERKKQGLRRPHRGGHRMGSRLNTWALVLVCPYTACVRAGVVGPCGPGWLGPPSAHRHSNVVILTTSNITERIDVAFVDRADIRQYIGPPSAAAIFKIYLSCLEELMRVPWVFSHFAKNTLAFLCVLDLLA